MSYYRGDPKKVFTSKSNQRFDWYHQVYFPLWPSVVYPWSLAGRGSGGPS